MKSDTGRKLKIHQTFRRHPGSDLNLVCKYHMPPVPRRFTTVLKTSSFSTKNSKIWIMLHEKVLTLANLWSTCYNFYNQYSCTPQLTSLLDTKGPLESVLTKRFLGANHSYFETIFSKPLRVDQKQCLNQRTDEARIKNITKRNLCFVFLTNAEKQQI